MFTPANSKHFTRVIDPDSKIARYILTTRACEYQQGFYFVNNSMTKDGRYLWFYATPTAVYSSQCRNLGYVDFLTDEVVICYDATFDDASPYIDPDTGDAYFTRCKSLYMRSPDKNSRTRRICSVPVAGYVSHISTHLTRTSDKEHFLLDIYRADFGTIVGLLNYKTGVFTEWARPKILTNHAQINPKDDTLSLCAYDGWASIVDGTPHKIPINSDGIYERLWTIRSNGERRMHPPMHNYATHEWWSADGKKIYYCCDGYGIYGINIETGEDIAIIEGVDPWHAHCTKDESLFVYDEKKLERYGGKWYRGCPAALNFLNRRTGKHLVVIPEMPENGFTPTNQNNYHIDPHPRFTENEKYIVFSTTELGGCDLALILTEDLIKATE